MPPPLKSNKQFKLTVVRHQKIIIYAFIFSEIDNNLLPIIVFLPIIDDRYTLHYNYGI